MDLDHVQHEINKILEKSNSGWNLSIPLIIASNKLPIRVFKNKETFEWQIEWAGDRIIESQNTFSHHEISKHAKIKFIGQIEPNDIIDMNMEDKKKIELQLIQNYNCYPIFIEENERIQYYNGYCKTTLWPLFHNIIDLYSPVDVVLDEKNIENLPTHYWTPAAQQASWQAYSNINRYFSNKICELYEPETVIWIQDYHLLLVPSFITRKIRSANIGIFLHIPFPSSEVFRTLSSRKEILRGMLNADHIGFHLFEYARHFLSCCKRILGIAYRSTIRGNIGVEYCGRKVSVTCCHMAIDADRVERNLSSEIVKSKVIELRRKYQGKIILAGCDAIERLKGIPLKMLAFDQFLSRCPDFLGRIVLCQYGVSRKARKIDYHQSRKEIYNVVKQINEKYFDIAKGNVIDFIEVNEVPFQERLALWRVADVQITTVLRDGLNTSPFEYIVAHRAAAGVLIISEFSGCSRLLNGAITVNPWELDQVIDSIRDAVQMSIKEREYRKNCDLQFVLSNPTKKWTKCVLDDIINARKKEGDVIYMGTGFGLDFRLMELSATFRKLQEVELANAYRNSSRRAIFLDYYRTIAPDTSNNVQSFWPDVPLPVLNCLEYLCKDPRNTVFIVSGCRRRLILEKFGSVPGLGLVAEHGYFLRFGIMGHSARLARPWEVFRSDDNSNIQYVTEDTCFSVGLTKTCQWRELVESIIQSYVDRTNGSALEIKESAILFRYARCDFEFGTMQAVELKDHLQNILQDWPLSVLQGKDYVEVRPKGLGKGAVVGKILEKMKQNGSSVDFILCIGDDTADELMFEKLDNMVQMKEIQEDKVFTCTVGQKPSKAKFYVNDHIEVISLLKALRVVSTKSNRNYSLSDMQSLMHQQPSLLSVSMHNTPYFSHPCRDFAKYRSLTPVMEEENIKNIDTTISFKNKSDKITDEIIMKKNKNNKKLNLFSLRRLSSYILFVYIIYHYRYKTIKFLKKIIKNLNY